MNVEPYSYPLAEFETSVLDGLVGNNLDADPSFVDVQEFDFHLQEDSPAIDAGMVVEEEDRFLGDAPDIGVYEYESG